MKKKVSSRRYKKPYPGGDKRGSEGLKIGEECKNSQRGPDIETHKLKPHRRGQEGKDHIMSIQEENCFPAGTGKLDTVHEEQTKTRIKKQN